MPEEEAGRRAADLLARVGLERFRARLAGALSGGMKQKLALVAALLTRPPLLLLDEPTTGVDPVSRREFWMLLNELHHEGLTIVVSTPYMDEAEYATRIGFLDDGRLSALGTREEILASYPRRLLVVRSAGSGAGAREALARAAGRSTTSRSSARSSTSAGPRESAPSSSRSCAGARGVVVPADESQPRPADARGRVRPQERRGRRRPA